ncbi:hypothetical protein ACVWXN_004658 [Bradyrhizobium sp. i1.4.4]
MAAAPLYNWTGCYLGANVGGGWTRLNTARALDVGGVAAPNDYGREKDSGVIGGGQVGCDFQTGNLVFGVGGSFDFGNIKGSHALTDFPAFSEANNLKEIYTATGRIGYLWTPQFLGYLKGGAAFIRERNQVFAPGGALIESASFMQPGMTIGIGAEWMFAPNCGRSSPSITTCRSSTTARGRSHWLAAARVKSSTSSSVPRPRWSASTTNSIGMPLSSPNTEVSRQTSNHSSPGTSGAPFLSEAPVQASPPIVRSVQRHQGWGSLMGLRSWLLILVTAAFAAHHSSCLGSPDRRRHPSPVGGNDQPSWCRQQCGARPEIGDGTKRLHAQRTLNAPQPRPDPMPFL